ncbi:Hypothetical protein BQ3484_345 [Cedratvirus A11]|uniref:Uncharacterized protein n=1 Tax=Cedratvirus A11 TaxID=1903266 RepID=A0A1M7XUP7_9VIRU|nr:Hypothetical protein BQ3484_345 [Cedratvirus A11]SHO33413.1 Hypothetical protein BQ3484_345 [Cedratvirus A11]
MQPEELELKGTIHDTKFRRFKNVWVEGGFSLFVPLWRYDLLSLGEIEIPEYTIEASELLSRIENYYKQPVSLAFLDDIERRDPTAQGELDEHRKRLLQGKRVIIRNLVGGLMFMEGIEPDVQGDYKLLLSS